MARGDRSAAAYRHVNVACIPEEHREEIIGDADAGGAEFGLRVVEVVHNGPAQSNIYGVYKGEDETRWEEAKIEFGIDEDADPNLDLTDSASRAAEEAAAKANAAEQAELDKIGSGKKKK